MRLEERPIAKTEGTILVHNIAYPNGRKALKKGTLLSQEHIAILQTLNYETILAAILDKDDVRENEAATGLAEVLQTIHLKPNRAAGGRVNLQAEVDGLLAIDVDRLRQLNNIPGISLATRPHNMMVGPKQTTNQVATLKIIPYAISKSDFQQALTLAQMRPGIITLNPLPSNRQAALLLIGHESVHAQLRHNFEPPTRTRLEKLNTTLTQVSLVPLDREAICQATSCLLDTNDLLIVAGHTSIMDIDDITPRGLRQAGANITVYGVPVEPGNLLAIAYLDHKAILCAPGCARSLNHNVVDLILPRLLLDQHLHQSDIAALGHGGLLEKVWL